MSMLDSFFKGNFKAAKCKTLLKLTIPRIKLLRNRREIQLKQMRRDIAKLLETGQEATARIRVEHIIREEKMMAAQEILELFCELIAVRLPIIETQRECPLDLKEAISSVCFAAPRCSDLTELLQVQMLFAAKYGKEFVSAATELMPECGVNRQLIELLSVRAPAPDVKLKLLKEIAEEHELDWDPAASETELLKPHEDLLNGPTESTFYPPKENQEKSPRYSASAQTPNESSATEETEHGFDASDFPEVPSLAPRPTAGAVSSPQMLPFPPSVLSDSEDEDIDEQEKPYEVVNENQSQNLPSKENYLSPKKQFLPFMSPPTSFSSASFPARQELHIPLPSSVPRSKTLTTRKDYNVDLQDVLAAAQAAADSAERAATAARSAATLVQVRISELVNKKNEGSNNSGNDNPFFDDSQKSGIDSQNSFSEEDQHYLGRQTSNVTASYDEPTEVDSSLSREDSVDHRPQRLPSLDDDTYSYPNLFTAPPPHGSNHISRSDS
jgi:vacuolar protein sorting-associated protein IST1